MTVHLVHALEKLKKNLLSLAAAAEEQMQQAIASFNECDLKTAQKVIERDLELDQMEVDLEEECLKTLALYQPVAFDLRFVVAVLKMNNDLERIGDLAAHIAERGLSVCTSGADKTQAPFDFSPMAENVNQMLRMSIDSLVNSDVSMAREVLKADEEIDNSHRKHFNDVKEKIISAPEAVQFFIEYLSVSRYLERIADLCTNIAEDVIYLVEGEIVRHSQ